MHTSSSGADGAMPPAAGSLPAAPRALPPARPRRRPAPHLEACPAPGSEGPPEALQTPPRPASIEAASKPKAKGDYEVGYGKPPKATQFKKGQSGNPAGRKKGAKGMKTIVRERMTEKVSVRTSSGLTKMTVIEALILRFRDQALGGNVRALMGLVKLYTAAVPDALPKEQTESHEDLSATDLAILEALRLSLALGDGAANDGAGNDGAAGNGAPCADAVPAAQVRAFDNKPPTADVGIGPAPAQGADLHGPAASDDEAGEDQHVRDPASDWDREI